ncbi:hypothetical protein [Enterocloster clostridioformis]|uniref:hypothetical protein n=2 Tax=Enterocloster clostridioformis TaxID=1531 RepID=UPI001FA915CE|nr:hypothetical protein [Enterocloster clostridioformis]
MYWKIPSNYGTLLTGKHQEVCHEAKNRRSLCTEDIRAKINGLQSLLDHAADLYSDIYSWYDSELKSYDPKATADDELFDPGTGTVVEGIDYLSIMESLSELQTANECKMQRD